jgi:dihydroorotate dehydrogenase electron transfer subunit
MPGIYLLWLEAPEIAAIAQPGQFMMVRCGDKLDPLLRRPLSIHRVADRKQVAFLFNVVGRGTEWLCQRQEGDSLDILGPLGKGFSIQPISGRLLLVAGGMGIAPLVFAAEKAIAEGHSVTLLMGAKNAALLYPKHLLSSSTDLITVTEDGSDGKKGMVTQFMADFINRADQILTCGPTSMYQAIAAQSQIKGKSIQVSLEVRMGCGRGVCYGCTIKTKNGLRQVCQDGPVFELGEVFWGELGLE